MFEAGLKSLAEFSSNRTRPVSSETTLMPTIAGDNSGLRRISVIRVCSSAKVFVEFAVFAFDSTAAGAGEETGAAAGDGEGEGDGEAVGTVVRSRCAVTVNVARGTVETTKRIDERNMAILEFFITCGKLSLSSQVKERFSYPSTDFRDFVLTRLINSANRGSLRRPSQFGSLSKHGRFS